MHIKIKQFIQLGLEIMTSNIKRDLIKTNNGKQQ